MPKVLPGKYWNAGRWRHMSANPRKLPDGMTRKGGYIGKFHRLPKRLRNPNFLCHHFDAVFLTKRDVRDACVSNIISTTANERKFLSLNERKDNRKAEILSHKKVANIRRSYINETLHKLVEERDLWLQPLEESGLNFFEWKYESFVENNISTFEGVFTYMASVHEGYYIPTGDEIRSMLDSCAKPIKLQRHYAKIARTIEPEAWARKNIKKGITDGWDVGVSCTGGRTRTFETFFNSEEKRQINEEYGPWLSENGYEI